MGFLIGVTSIDASLVHHTGSMIRFRTSQLGSLPASDATCSVTLMDGRTVQGRFHRHRDNPYIGGPELVRWIKQWIDWNNPQPVVVQQVGSGMHIRLRPSNGIATPTTNGRRVRRKALRLASLTDGVRRRREYTAWERDPALREFILNLWKARCQVVGCTSSRKLANHLAHSILDVHHINSVARGGSDSTSNLCLICANHHALIHRSPSSRVLSSGPEEVRVAVNGMTLVIRRKISDIWESLDA